MKISGVLLCSGAMLMGGVGAGGGPATPRPAEVSMRTDAMYPALAEYLRARAAEFGSISAERREQLDAVGAYIRTELAAQRPVRLLFVCTHNSRRSHLAQLWTAAAGVAYGLGVETFSGGTEATAFNARAVAAAERAGFTIVKTGEGTNPAYSVRMGENVPAMVCFSKRFQEPPNPRTEFAAVMVCSDADKACPSVPGARVRFAIPYEDPKAADNTPAEAATYDARCAQIATEMLYVMSRAGT